MGCKKLLSVSHSQLFEKSNMVSRTCLTSNATPAQENSSPQWIPRIKSYYNLGWFCMLLSLHGCQLPWDKTIHYRWQLYVIGQKILCVEHLSVIWQIFCRSCSSLDTHCLMIDKINTNIFSGICRWWDHRWKWWCFIRQYLHAKQLTNAVKHPTCSWSPV